MGQVLDEQLQSERFLTSREMAAIFNVKIETFQGWVRRKAPQLDGCPKFRVFGARTRRWPYVHVSEWLATRGLELSDESRVEANDNDEIPPKRAVKLLPKTT